MKEGANTTQNPNLNQQNKFFQSELQTLNNQQKEGFGMDLAIQNRKHNILEDSFENDNDAINQNAEQSLNKPNGEEPEKKYIGSGKPVGTFELYFKYASISDTILIVLAMIGSLGSGLSMPLFSVLFGGKIRFLF